MFFYVVVLVRLWYVACTALHSRAFYSVGFPVNQYVYLLLFHIISSVLYLTRWMLISVIVSVVLPPRLSIFFPENIGFFTLLCY